MPDEVANIISTICVLRIQNKQTTNVVKFFILSVYYLKGLFIQKKDPTIMENPCKTESRGDALVKRCGNPDSPFGPLICPIFFFICDHVM